MFETFYFAWLPICLVLTECEWKFQHTTMWYNSFLTKWDHSKLPLDSFIRESWAFYSHRILSIVRTFCVCRCYKFVQHNKNVATNVNKKVEEKIPLFCRNHVWYHPTHIVMERTFQTIAAMWMIRNQFDCRAKHHFPFVLFISVACWVFPISEYINDKEKSHTAGGGAWKENGIDR